MDYIERSIWHNVIEIRIEVKRVISFQYGTESPAGEAPYFRLLTGQVAEVSIYPQVPEIDSRMKPNLSPR